MKKNLVAQIFVAFVLGLIVGIAFWLAKLPIDNFVTWVSPFGHVLVAMLKMIVIPVIFLSLITGAASVPTKEFGKIGLKVIIWYLLTSLFAAMLGSVLAGFFNPGGGSSHDAWASLMRMEDATEIVPVASNSITDIFLSMFENPFSALANGNFLAIIVYAITFGLALKIVFDKGNMAMRDNVQRLLGILEAAKEAIFKMVDWILAYSPIGVFALTAVNFAQYGDSLFGPYVKLTLGVILGIIGMIVVIYPVMMAVTLRENPYKTLFKMKEPMLTAFVTRSSAAALPVSLRVSEEELFISEKVSSFSLPLGSTINMDGVCIHLPMFAVLAANMFGVDLTFTDLTLLVVTTVLASVGAGGVPGGSLMLLFIILQNMGLQQGQIAVIVGLALGINPILDMFETMNNVTGDIVCTYSVAKMHNLVGPEHITPAID
ncbi:MAG: dicarboxylate/amino acid:cation symporter [Tissierellia bacterium]|nr:dicarboxylate/amino acid:cation symporter [Tissierellia bacterium]